MHIHVLHLCLIATYFICFALFQSRLHVYKYHGIQLQSDTIELLLSAKKEVTELVFAFRWVLVSGWTMIFIWVRSPWAKIKRIWLK